MSADGFSFGKIIQIHVSKMSYFTFPIVKSLSRTGKMTVLPLLFIYPRNVIFKEWSFLRVLVRSLFQSKNTPLLQRNATHQLLSFSSHNCHKSFTGGVKYTKKIFLRFLSCYFSFKCAQRREAPIKRKLVSTRTWCFWRYSRLSPLLVCGLAFINVSRSTCYF